MEYNHRIHKSSIKGGSSEQPLVRGMSIFLHEKLFKKLFSNAGKALVTGWSNYGALRDVKYMDTEEACSAGTGTGTPAVSFLSERLHHSNVLAGKVRAARACHSLCTFIVEHKVVATVEVSCAVASDLISPAVWSIQVEEIWIATWCCIDAIWVAGADLGGDV